MREVEKKKEKGGGVSELQNKERECVKGREVRNAIMEGERGVMDGWRE